MNRPKEMPYDQQNQSTNDKQVNNITNIWSEQHGRKSGNIKSTKVPKPNFVIYQNHPLIAVRWILPARTEFTPAIQVPHCPLINETLDHFLSKRRRCRWILVRHYDGKLVGGVGGHGQRWARWAGNIEQDIIRVLLSDWWLKRVFEGPSKTHNMKRHTLP